MLQVVGQNNINKINNNKIRLMSFASLQLINTINIGSVQNCWKMWLGQMKSYWPKFARISDQWNAMKENAPARGIWQANKWGTKQASPQNKFCHTGL